MSITIDRVRCRTRSTRSMSIEFDRSMSIDRIDSMSNRSRVPARDRAAAATADGSAGATPGPGGASDDAGRRGAPAEVGGRGVPRIGDPRRGERADERVGGYGGGAPRVPAGCVYPAPPKGGVAVRHGGWRVRYPPQGGGGPEGKGPLTRSPARRATPGKRGEGPRLLRGGPSTGPGVGTGVGVPRGPGSDPGTERGGTRSGGRGRPPPTHSPRSASGRDTLGWGVPLRRGG